MALWRVPHVLGGGGRWKKQHRKIVPLSPYIEKPLNSKVIKGFVPELRSRKCFSCFGIPMFYVYMLWTFYVRFAYLFHGYVTNEGVLHIPQSSNITGTSPSDCLMSYIKKIFFIKWYCNSFPDKYLFYLFIFVASIKKSNILLREMNACVAVEKWWNAVSVCLVWKFQSPVFQIKKKTVAFQIVVCLMNWREIWIWKNILTKKKKIRKNIELVQWKRLDLSPVFHLSKNQNSNIYKVMIINFIITFIHNYLCIEKNPLL